LHSCSIVNFRVVYRERFPWFTSVRLARSITGDVPCLLRDFVAADMVGMRVAASLVVGHHDMGAVLPHECHEWFCRNLNGNVAEGIRWERIPLRHIPRVFISEPSVLKANDAGGVVHLVSTLTGKIVSTLRVSGRELVEHVSAFPAGAAHNHHLHTSVEVVRVCRRSLAR